MTESGSLKTSVRIEILGLDISNHVTNTVKARDLHDITHWMLDDGDEAFDWLYGHV